MLHYAPSEEDRMETERRILQFKDFKGFKKSHDIETKYKLLEVLGRGAFGEVRKAEHVKANVQCAVKIIRKAAIEEH